MAWQAPGDCNVVTRERAMFKDNLSAPAQFRLNCENMYLLARRSLKKTNRLLKIFGDHEDIVTGILCIFVRFGMFSAHIR